MTTKNLILFLSIAFCNITSTMEEKNIATVECNYERNQNITPFKYEYPKTQPYYPRLHAVISPCSCISNTCYSNEQLAELVQNSINLVSLSNRKKTVAALLKKTMRSQSGISELQNNNLACNFYNNNTTYVNNLTTLIQAKLELQHAISLLSHIQQCDAALTLQSWKRKISAQKMLDTLKDEKLKQQAIQKEKSEQIAMQKEENLTRRYIANEKQQALQLLAKDQKDQKRKIEEERKKQQRQKNLEIAQQKINQKNEKLNAEKLKKEQEKRIQKEKSQLKKERELAQKKAAQDRENEELAYLTSAAESQSIANTKTMAQIKKSSSTTTAKVSKLIEKPQLKESQTKFTITILPKISSDTKETPLQTTPTNSMASLNESDSDGDDLLNYLTRRKQFIREISEAQSANMKIAEKLQMHQADPEQVDIADATQQQKVLDTAIKYHENSTEYNNFIEWSKQQSIKKTQREEAKEIQRLKDLKTVIKSKAADREKLKSSLSKQREENFAYSSNIEENVLNQLETYNDALHRKVSFQVIERLEQIFVASDQQLTEKNESLKWYLAHHHDIYNSIKQQYLSLQRDISHAERCERKKQYVELTVKIKNESLSKQESDKLKYDYDQLLPKIYQVRILEKLEKIHTKNGILDISKLLYPEVPIVDINTKGVLSQEDFDHAESRIKLNLLNKKRSYDFQTVVPILKELLVKANVQCHILLLNSIVNTSAQIALVPKPKGPSDMLEEIRRSTFVTIQRENELAVNHESVDQIADRVKSHLCIIKTFMDIKENQSDK